MAQVNAGRVRFVSKGTYNNSTQYYLFDLVNYNGTSYFAKGNTLGNLPTNTEYWQVIAEKGNKGDTGETGATGNGISNITKTGTSGLVDTYTITYTNGNTTTFTVSNGKGISNIVKTGSAGLIDNYRITYNDGTYFDYIVTNGQDGEVTEEELQDVYEQMSSELEDGTLTGTSIDTSDSAYWKAGIDLSGNTEQSTNIITYTCDGTETGDYYFVYNSTNYQFTMPTVSSGDVIYFNTDTLKLYLLQTEIQTTTASTGTLITMTATPNPPYPQDIQVVKGSNNVKVQNKNYLDISKCVMGANNTTVDTTITYSTKTNRACTKFDVNPIYVKPSTTYTIKRDSNYNFSVAQLNSRNRVLSDSGWKSANFSFTTSANCQKITMNFKKNNDANFTIEEFKTAEFQVEKGSTATSFIPHQEQNYPITLPTGMELCKIGDYQDYIYKNLVNGNWYKHSEIGKIILNGTETWTYQSQYPRFYTTNISEMFKTGGNAYSTHYIRDDTGSINNTFDFWSDGTNRQCLIHDERFTTMADLNNWLSSNNVICYGRLRTPTYTQITDTTLINQLNDIYNKLKTYQGISHITQTNEDMPFILTLDYKKSNLLRIKALEEANS